MIVIPSTIENISTRADGSIKIVLGTQIITPEKVGQLFELRSKLGYVALKNAEFQPDEIQALTDIDEDLQDWGKSKSQIQRNVLFKLFMQKPEGYQDFNQYYNAKMDIIINHYKSKIE